MIGIFLISVEKFIGFWLEGMWTKFFDGKHNEKSLLR